MFKKTVKNYQQQKKLGGTVIVAARALHQLKPRIEDTQKDTLHKKHASNTHTRTQNKRL